MEGKDEVKEVNSRKEFERREMDRIWIEMKSIHLRITSDEKTEKDKGWVQFEIQTTVPSESYRLYRNRQDSAEAQKVESVQMRQDE